MVATLHFFLRSGKTSVSRCPNYSSRCRKRKRRCNDRGLAVSIHVYRRKEHMGAPSSYVHMSTAWDSRRKREMTNPYIFVLDYLNRTDGALSMKASMLFVVCRPK
ncbi:hypothetical protein Naga_100135g3 [Nannochloropsis gaditana]|uniref:Uncharacterized protein n=1 Tax=Nannochloropsis gaditana TaxID=72520 RepID=W7TE61_9STRA|nr:hypothetical protein Naga_100135g3 [Nannochloropsis gaditana]